MAHEWDKSNFKKFSSYIFGTSLESNILKKSLNYLHESLIANAAYSLLSFREKSETMSRKGVVFSGIFIDDLRNYCNSNYIFFEDQEVDNIFSKIKYSSERNTNSPYKNITLAKKCCLSIMRGQDESSAGNTHDAKSMTWSQLYNVHIGGLPQNKSDLIKKYQSFFRSTYKYDEADSLALSVILMKKCLMKLYSLGLAQSRGESVLGKNSGEFQRQGIRILANIHGSRSDLAGGEKSSLAKVMTAFCFQPNLFQINKNKVVELMSEDFSSINSFEPTKHMSSISEDSLSGRDFFTGMSLRKDAVEKEIELIRMLEESSDENAIRTIGISEEDLQNFLGRSEFQLYQGKRTGWVESQLSPKDVSEIVMEHYNDGFTIECKDEYPEDVTLWGLELYELSDKAVQLMFPLDSFIHMNHEFINSIKQYIVSKLPNEFKIENHENKDYVLIK